MMPYLSFTGTLRPNAATTPAIREGSCCGRRAGHRHDAIPRLACDLRLVGSVQCLDPVDRVARGMGGGTV